MDFLSGIQGDKVKFKNDGGNTNGAAKIQQAQNELASIFQEQESVNTEIETKETELAENNEQEQQQVQEITDSLSSAQSEFEAAHSAFQEADSTASSAESNATAMAAAAESLPKEIEEEVPDGEDANGNPKTKKVKKPNPAYLAAKAEAEAAKAQASELRNQANTLKEQEAQAQEVCNEIIEALSELEDSEEENEQETEEKDSELEILKEQYEQFKDRINELNTGIEEAEKEAQQEEKEPDEEGMALYESANTIDGMDQRYIDNGDGTRTIIDPDGTQSTVEIDEETGNIRGITDNEGNTTTYQFSTKYDMNNNTSTTVLNKSTTNNVNDNSTTITEADKDGKYDTNKYDSQNKNIYIQDANKDETIVTSTTDTDTGIKTTIDKKGNVTYKDENGEELDLKDVRERRYEESLDDCRLKEQSYYNPDIPNASEESKEPTDNNKDIRGSETDEPEFTHEDQDILQAEFHIEELEENPDKVFTELLQKDTTKAVNIMEYAEDIEKEFIDALYSLPEDKKNEYTDQIIDTLIDFGENTYNRTRPGNFVLDILENKDDNSSNFVERFVEKAPNEFLEKCFEDNQFAEDIIDLLPYVTETTYTRLEECGLYSAINKKLESQGLNREIEDSSQGGIGDCWLLSSINSLSYTEAGRKILDEAVTEKEDGSGYVINFKGLNKEIEISNIEILDAIKTGEYSTGDADMVMWELAFEKADIENKSDNVSATKKTSNTNNHEILNGGNTYSMINSLTGKEVNYYELKTYDYSYHTPKPISDLVKTIDKIGDKILGIETMAETILNEMKSNKNIAATCFFSPKTKQEAKTITDINGVEHNTGIGKTSGHGWAIKSVDSKNVTIVNPWDSSEEVIITRKEFESSVSGICYIDLSDI